MCRADRETVHQIAEVVAPGTPLGGHRIDVDGVDRARAEQVEHPRRNRKIACFIGQAKPLVGLDRVEALILQRIGAQFIDQSNPAVDSLEALATVTIPALMIFLSVALPANVNRWANIVIAAVNIPFILFNLAGEAWIHMMFGAVVEVVILCLIIHYAWKWPRVEM